MNKMCFFIEHESIKAEIILCPAGGLFFNFGFDMAFFSVGKVAGSVVFGGIIFEKLDFYWTMLITAFFFTAGTLLSNGYLLLSKNYGKMHYQTENSAVTTAPAAAESESPDNRSV